MLLPQTHISSQTTFEKGSNPWRVSVFLGWREKLECVFCQSQLHVLSFAELNYTTIFHPTGPPFDLILFLSFGPRKNNIKISIIFHSQPKPVSQGQKEEAALFFSSHHLSSWASRKLYPTQLLGLIFLPSTKLNRNNLLSSCLLEEPSPCSFA